MGLGKWRHILACTSIISSKGFQISRNVLLPPRVPALPPAPIISLPTPTGRRDRLQATRHEASDREGKNNNPSNFALSRSARKSPWAGGGQAVGQGLPTNTSMVTLMRERMLGEKLPILQKYNKLRTERPRCSEAELATLVLGPNATVKMLRLSLKEAERARSELVVGAMVMVRSLAAKYKHAASMKGLELGELYQEGCVGLMDATERFDYRNGARFSTFAYSYARAYMLSMLKEHRTGLRVNRGLDDAMSKLRKARDRLMSLNGGSSAISKQEWAAEAGVSVSRLEDVLRLWQSTSNTVPLNAVSSPGRGGNLGSSSSTSNVASQWSSGDGLGSLEAVAALSESQPASDSLQEELEVESIVKRALETLSQDEAHVLRIRYGVGLSNQFRMNDVRGKKAKNPQAALSLGEVARQLGTTPYKVSILEERALLGLRAALRRDSVEGELLRDNLAPKGFTPRDESEMIGDEVVVWPRSPVTNKLPPAHAFPTGGLLGLPPGHSDGGFSHKSPASYELSIYNASGQVLLDGILWPMSPAAPALKNPASEKAPLPVLLGTPAENRAFLLGRGLTVSSMKRHQSSLDQNKTGDAVPFLLNLPSKGVVSNIAMSTDDYKKVSKFKGVSWHSRDNKWQAQIMVDGIVKHLGYFKSDEAAARKYDGYAGALDRPMNFPGGEGTGRASKRRQNRVASTVKKASAYVGVHWDRREARWRTEISVQRKRIHLGYFDDEKEAAQAYDRAAAPHGRRLNFPPSDSLLEACAKDELPECQSSPFVGVSWDKRRKKWVAQIKIGQKKLHLGYFESDVSAARAYDKKAAPVGRKANFLDHADLGESEAELALAVPKPEKTEYRATSS